ncbi:hypothetical protein SAMN05444274_101176 [Mariniphaga anaerophila]|uniref:Gliding motility protein GldL-like N-terminal domain-containing protein n=1 Tax=Mariniphaga anaerophila TaxID=1484053 RepID=A0A1M4SX23_9BACT|nr:hypothetical protein [Mariniphaga anaerophila]SHE36699.1 hypothetical protein SAMN05444274_101176 [Mariniphaga anaerophila]
MKDKQLEKLMNVLFGVSALLVLIGAFFKLQHYPNGSAILWIGFISGFVLYNIEIARLKKVIKELEQKIRKGDKKSEEAT